MYARVLWGRTERSGVDWTIVRERILIYIYIYIEREREIEREIYACVNIYIYIDTYIMYIYMYIYNIQYILMQCIHTSLLGAAVSMCGLASACPNY